MHSGAFSLRIKKKIKVKNRPIPISATGRKSQGIIDMGNDINALNNIGFL